MPFLRDAVEAISANWSELSGLLDAAERDEVVAIMADADADPWAAADELRDLVKPLLPPGHPVREALTPSGLRFHAGETLEADHPALRESLRHFRGLLAAEGSAAPAVAGEPAPAGGPAYAPEPAAPPRYVPDADDTWLLAEPARPAAELGLSPEQAGRLIVLTDAQGVERAPAFQLDPRTGTPYPVVVEINQLLSADEDPWGAADWWLGSNVWLDAPPARLLGTGVDHALLSAARAEIPEW
ncbi:hypothetical protein [Streptomyces sp. NBC_01198]|uniref:hypothetical protein n=1 Tax=Streptomyces sp. NBC_01198 TaxID=2903769 RepID=UPI002E142569|nr:hypothetical protein OG702_19835 [Streptomyces sp. NBC_01198]